MFRPHWTHRECGGIIAGSRNVYQCDRCGENAPAIGAEIPADIENHREYFATHPELEVALLNADQVSRVANVLFDN